MRRGILRDEKPHFEPFFHPSPLHLSSAHLSTKRIYSQSSALDYIHSAPLVLVSSNHRGRSTRPFKYFSPNENPKTIISRFVSLIFTLHHAVSPSPPVWLTFQPSTSNKIFRPDSWPKSRKDYSSSESTGLESEWVCQKNVGPHQHVGEVMKEKSITDGPAKLVCCRSSDFNSHGLSSGPLSRVGVAFIAARHTLHQKGPERKQTLRAPRDRTGGEKARGDMSIKSRSSSKAKFRRFH